MYTGTLVKYLDKRGFGFVAIGHGTDADRAYFVHISELQKAGVDIPCVGAEFQFEVAEREDGKKRGTQKSRKLSFSNTGGTRFHTHFRFKS